MSQAESLLNSLSEEEMAELSNESERHIVIGKDRVIVVPNELKRIAVQFDHDVETVTFDCVRYWDNIDMSTMYIFINYMLPNGNKGSYLAQNVAVDSEDENIMHFMWTISSALTATKGTIKFLVCVKKTDLDGNEINHWNSELNEDIYVSEGLEVSNTVATQNSDIITQLLTKMEVIEEDIDTVETQNRNIIARMEEIEEDIDTVATQNSDIIARMEEIEDNTSAVCHFNLATMGLPSVVIGGNPVELETGTDEIMTALDNGAVKFTFNVNMGADVPINAVVTNISMGGAYICAYTFEYMQIPLMLLIEISVGYISVVAKVLFEEKTVSSIDMSNFEANGTIIEQYADGTTKTTTIEFDENGNPIKITDGDGNVLTLTW